MKSNQTNPQKPTFTPPKTKAEWAAWYATERRRPEYVDHLTKFKALVIAFAATQLMDPNTPPELVWLYDYLATNVNFHTARAGQACTDHYCLAEHYAFFTRLVDTLQLSPAMFLKIKLPKIITLLPPPMPTPPTLKPTRTFPPLTKPDTTFAATARPPKPRLAASGLVNRARIANALINS